MPAPDPRRSTVRPAAARRMRLARRLACGLTPAEVARVEAATEEEILHLLDDADFSGLVREYRAVVELPDDLREARLIGAAWMELEHLMELGDRRAVLFVVYEVEPRPASGRGAAEADERGVRAGRGRDGAPRPGRARPGAAALRADARLWLAPAGPRPGGRPAPDRHGRRGGRTGYSSRGRAPRRPLPRPPPRRRPPRASPLPPPRPSFPPCPGPPRASPSHRPATAWSGCPATPASPTSPTSCPSPRSPSSPTIFPTSPTGSSAAASSAWPSWPSKRAEAEPDRPQRSAGQKPLGP